MHPIIELHREELLAICRRRGLRRLELFGSAARDDFDETRSDIDFLVEFGDDPQDRGMAAYFQLKDELESCLDRPVDLVELGAVRNPYVQASIARDRRVLYGA